jgi:hypothetical protein
MYFPKLYEQDLIAYRSLIKDCLCGRVIDDIRKNHSDKILHLRQFYVHNFFLTIFSETIDDSFPEYNERWRQECLEYIDYKCTNNSSRIFWATYTQRKKYKGETMKVHPSEYVQAAQEVITYTDQILQKEGFEGLTAEMIRDQIMNNDKHPEAIRMMVSDEYLSILKGLK